jgi:hypothetical protein
MRVLCSAVLLTGGLLFPVFSEKPDMTWEQYLAELNSVVLREKTTRESIAGEQALIESLKQQIFQMQQRIAGVIQEKYRILGITEPDVTNAESELADIQSGLRQFAYVSNDALIPRRQEIQQLDNRFNALKAKRVCLLYRVAEKVREVEPALSQVLQQLGQALAAPPKVMAPAAWSTYTIGPSGTGRNLSQIAAELYGDQYQWPRIYRANKAMIDKWYEQYKAGTDSAKISRPQDFVLPGWTLEIPR